MEQNAAVRMAENLYEQKNYLGAAQAAIELLKEPETVKYGHLIFTKAFTFLVPSANDKDKLETLYSSAGSAAAGAETIEEYFDIERQIMEAHEEWTRQQMTTIVGNLERKANLDYWKAFISMPQDYLMVGIMLSVHMRNQPNSKKWREEAGGKIDELLEKYDANPKNKFTNEEKDQLIYDAACRVYQQVISDARNKLDGSVEYVRANSGPIIQKIYLVKLMIDYATPDLNKGDQELRIKRLEKLMECIRGFLAIKAFPNGRGMWLLTDSTRTDWENDLRTAESDIQKTKKAIEKQRIEAYWEKHAEQKAQLDKESAEIKARVKELDAPIQKAEKEADQLKQEKSRKIPSEIACDKQRTVISDLEIERSRCGIFKGKQKKALTERIDTIEKPRLAELEKEAATCRKTYDEEMDAKIKAVMDTVAPQMSERKKLDQRAKEIERELTRPR